MALGRDNDIIVSKYSRVSFERRKYFSVIGYVDILEIDCQRKSLIPAQENIFRSKLDKNKNQKHIHQNEI